VIAEPEHEIALIGIRLLDDAYMAWYAAQSECRRTFGAWCDASPRNQESTYFSYRAALDREEAAARDLQRLRELTQPCYNHLARRDALESR
jgi:hypothetical protein